MTKDYTKYLAATVGVFVTTAIVAGATYAYQGNGESFKARRPFNENYQAIIKAVENNDYSTWKSLVEEQSKKTAGFISEENFNKIVAMHEAARAGNREMAKSISEELDMPVMMDFGFFGRHGMNKGFGKGKEMTTQQHDAIREAVENNDYELWKSLIGDHFLAEKITADNFSKLVKSHNLMQEGKFDEARQIREEIGLSFGRGFGR